MNWADQRDNFVNGVLYPSGLSSSDTYSSAATVANRVVGQMYSITGANTVRMPVDEPTVSTYWGTYTGAIDTALSKGNVILAYWAYAGGKPVNTTTFYQMWDRIVGKYASNPNAYFEVINEPYGMSTSSLDSLYSTWLNWYPSLPRGRVILDGTGTITNGANAKQSTCDSANTNQQWTVVTDGSYQRFQDRGTGLYIDGMGRTATGSDLGQYSSSSSTNQQWQLVAAS